MLVTLLSGIFATSLAVFSQTKRQPPTPTSPTPQSATAVPMAAREEAYRANNLGVALLAQIKYKEGAEAFQRALSINPQLAIARLNLAVTRYNAPDVACALR